MPRIGKTIKTESRLLVARNWGKREWEVTAGGTEFLFRMVKIFWNWRLVVAKHCKYTKMTELYSLEG